MIEAASTVSAWNPIQEASVTVLNRWKYVHSYSLRSYYWIVRQKIGPAKNKEYVTKCSNDVNANAKKEEIGCENYGSYRTKYVVSTIKKILSNNNNREPFLHKCLQNYLDILL